MNDVIDEVRLLAPPFEPTSEAERARQRQKLTVAIAVELGGSSGGGVPALRAGSGGGAPVGCVQGEARDEGIEATGLTPPHLETYEVAVHA